jgi:hypothetical protein
VVLDLFLLWLLWPAVIRGVVVARWRSRTGFALAGLASAVPVILVFLIATFPGEWLDQQFPVTPLRTTLVAGKVDYEARKPTSLWSSVLVQNAPRPEGSSVSPSRKSDPRKGRSKVTGRLGWPRASLSRRRKIGYDTKKGSGRNSKCRSPSFC